MSEYHFPIPGAESEKEIVIFTRRHWVSFLGQFLLSFFLIILPIIILVVIYAFHLNQRFFHEPVTNLLVLVGSIYFLIVITFAFAAWVSFYYNVYIVTQTEIIDISQVGFFGREIMQLPLIRVQDVTSIIKGFLPTVFAYGNVLVETASEQKEPFILCAVPNPQEIASEIMKLHDEVIETEGRHHQMLEGEGVLLPGHIAEKKQPIESPPPIEPQNPKTSYQELLEKEKQETPKPQTQKTEGEISKDDLDKGGEVDLK